MWPVGVLLWLVILGASGCRPLGGWGALDPAAWWLRWQSEASKQRQFHAAWKTWKKKQYPDAYAAFVRVARAYPELADHSWYHAARAAELAGHRHDAAAAMSRVARHYPDSVFFVEAATWLAEWEEQNGRMGEAQRWATRVAGLLAPPPWPQRAQLVLARCQERQGNVLVAARTYRDVWAQARHPEVRARARQFLREVRTAHPELEPGGAERVTEAEWAVRDRDWDLARTLATPLVAAADTDVRARAAVVLAEVALAAGEWDDALAGFWAVGTRLPESRTGAAALYRMARVLWNRHRDAAADRVFAELVRRYPAADEAPRAVLARARIADAAGQPARALELLRATDQLVVRPDVEHDIRWWRGWWAWKVGDLGSAAAWFEQLGADNEQALYWRARVAGARGQEARARELYRKLVAGRPSYYGYLAERQLRGLGDAPVRVFPAALAAPALPPIPPQPVADPFHFPRWQRLLASGVLPLARRELAVLAATVPVGDPRVWPFLQAAWVHTEAYADALRALRTWPNVSAAERDALEYPLAYFSLVDASARVQRLDPLFLLAVMRQESLFDPDVCSAAGACGLLQLMPATARRVAASLGLAPEAVDLTDPEQNIALGARHLRELLDRYGEDPLVALAAYNGGERAADRWLALSRGRAPDEFVEEITYRETRDYVKRVWTHYVRYRKLYAAS